MFALYLSTLYFLQDKLLYKPDKNYISPQKANLNDVRENMLTMSDGAKVMTWAKDGNKDLPALLFFHGDAIAVHLPTFHPLSSVLFIKKLP